MMWKVSLLVYIDSQIDKLTIKLHFDQFTAMPLKEKLYFFTIHPIFSIASLCTLSNENTLISQKLLSNILVYNCRPNTHLPNPTNGFSVTAHAQLSFEKLLASCIWWFINAV